LHGLYNTKTENIKNLFFMLMSSISSTGSVFTIA